MNFGIQNKCNITIMLQNKRINNHTFAIRLQTENPALLLQAEVAIVA